MPRKPQRCLRIEDEVWLPASLKAYKKDTTISDVVRQALIAYLAEPDTHPQRRAGDPPPDFDYLQRLAQVRQAELARRQAPGGSGRAG